MKGCIVCGTCQVQKLVRTHDRHHGIPDEYDVVVCTGCGLRRMDPLPGQSELLAFYGSDYYSYAPPSRPAWWKRFGQRFTRSPIPTHNPTFGIPGDFLDVGCGAGAYLRVMREEGWRVYGVEPVLAGVEEGQKAGFDIRHGSLLDVRFPDASFDYVRSNHSFEHMVNPLEVLTEIKRILRPGGKLFLGVPNADSIPARLFGRYWWYMGVPLHPYTYSPNTLTSLLAKAGFASDVLYYNSSFGSVTGSVQIYLNRNNGRKAGDGWFFRNPALKVLGNVVARIFDFLHRGDAIEVIASHQQEHHASVSSNIGNETERSFDSNVTDRR